MSLIVVVGATGAQGGSVINQLKESLNWKVRGITRNVKGDKAGALSQQVNY